jgi:DNA-binding HxlR family transcriptional regulator/putative sterol carrier protein
VTPIHRYDDPCGVARALDLVGDRWALLVVRELIFGPKRFTQLRDGLRSVSPNVLSQRLRDLEDTGLVRREVLDPPASVAIYELTERGRALEPILTELGRWGSQEPLTTSSELSVSALLLALKTVFDPVSAFDVMYALRIDGEWFRVNVTDGSIDIAGGRPEGADALIETDSATLRAVAFGREALTAAEKAGRLHVEGDRGVATHFTKMFSVPKGKPKG